MAQGQLYGRNRHRVDIHHIVKQYEVYAGESISVGDFVEYINGISKYQNYGETDHVRITRYDELIDNITATKIDETRVLATYEASSGSLACVILSINGNSITVGTSSYIVDTYYGIASCNVAKIKENSFLVSYWYKYDKNLKFNTMAQVVTINGTTISSSGETVLWDENCNNTMGIAANGENQGIIMGAYDSGDELRAIAVQIQNNKIVKTGSTLSISTASTNNHYLFSIEQNKLFVGYSEKSPGTAYFSILNVNGMTLSVSSAINLGNGATSHMDAIQLATDKLFVVDQETSETSMWMVSAKTNSVSVTRLTSNESLPVKVWRCGKINDKTVFAICDGQARVLELTDTSVKVNSALGWVPSGFSVRNNIYIPVVINPKCVIINVFANNDEASSRPFENITLLLSVDGNTVTKNITNSLLSIQVRPSTSAKFDGIAITSGVGGDILGAKDKVKIQTYTEPVHILESYKDVPTTDFYYNEKSSPATIFVTNNTLRRCLYTKSGKNILLWDIMDTNKYYINVAATEFNVDGIVSPMIKENITNGQQVQEIDICVTKRDKICIIYKIDSTTYLFSCTTSGEVLADSVVLSNEDWIQVKIDTFSDEKLAVLYSDRKDIYLAIYHTNGTLLEKHLVNTFSMDGLLDVTVSDQDYAYIAYSAIEATLPSIKTRLNEYMPKVQSYDIVKWSTDLSKTTFNLTVGDQTRPIIIEAGEGKFVYDDDVEKFFQDKVDAEFGLYQVKCNVTKSTEGYLLEFERAEEVPNVEIMVSAPDSETDLYSKNAEVLETSDSLKLATKDVLGSGTTADPGSGYKNALPLLKMLDMSSSLLNLNTPIMQFVETNATTFTYSINDAEKTLSTSTTIANFFAAINNNDDKFHIEYLLSEDIILIKGDSEIRISDNIGLFTKLGFTIKETPPASDYVHTSQSTYVAAYDYINTKKFNWKLIDARSASLEWIDNDKDLILYTQPMASKEVQLRFFDGSSPYQRRMMSYTPSQARIISLGVVRAADDRLFVAMSDDTSTILYNEDWSVFCEIIDQPSRYVYPYLRTDKDIGITFVDTNSTVKMSNVILSGRYDYLVRQYTVDGIRESKGAIIRVQNDSAKILSDIAKNAINNIFFDTIIQVGESYTLRHDGEKWVVLTY